MSKRNCWEFKACGREPGGAKAQELGVCPAATEKTVDGVNHGKNGGRACWVMTGTLCGGQQQGDFASKLLKCMECDFHNQVVKDEGSELQGSKEILEKIKKSA